MKALVALRELALVALSWSLSWMATVLLFVSMLACCPSGYVFSAKPSLPASRTRLEAAVELHYFYYSKVEDPWIHPGYPLLTLLRGLSFLASLSAGAVLLLVTLLIGSIPVFPIVLQLFIDGEHVLDFSARNMVLFSSLRCFPASHSASLKGLLMGLSLDADLQAPSFEFRASNLCADVELSIQPILDRARSVVRDLLGWQTYHPGHASIEVACNVRTGDCTANISSFSLPATLYLFVKNIVMSFTPSSCVDASLDYLPCDVDIPFIFVLSRIVLTHIKQIAVHNILNKFPDIVDTTGSWCCRVEKLDAALHCHRWAAHLQSLASSGQWRRVCGQWSHQEQTFQIEIDEADWDPVDVID